MLSIEKKIAPLVEQQFPAFYREEGQLFIAFMKAYYEWMENYTQLLNLRDATGFNVGDTVTQAKTTGTIIAKNDNSVLVEVDDFAIFRCNINCDTLNPLTSSSGTTSFIESNQNFSPLFWSRHLPEIRDIDRTLDRFILQFKNKYLPNIQFVTASNKELFIKNSLDFYRAKGTERAVDLFFKLIYGFEANVYYPGDDLFKPSDNEWVNVLYLEIESADTNVNMIGQIVHGSVSGANGFAERLVRVKKEGRFINVLYLSNLNGDFQTGENIFTKDLTTNVTAKIYGSLTSFEILASDDGFEVGEDLFVEGGEGKRGRARVRQTQTFIGTVDFDLLEGGWGYTANAEIIGSDNVIQLANITNANTNFLNLNQTFQQFETVRQYLFELNSANSEFDFGVTDTATIYANTEPVVNGVVVFANSSQLILNYDLSTASNTTLLADTDAFDSVENETGNSYILSDATDVSVVAEVMAVSSNSTITYTSSTNVRLNEGDILYQTGTINNKELRIANGSVDRAFIEFDPSTNTFVNFISDIGTLRTDRSFYRDRDDEEFTIVSISNTNIGIHQKQGLNTTNASSYNFYALGEVIGSNSGVTATATGVFAFETEADFVIPATEFEESYFIENFKNDEIIGVIDLANTEIGANTYDQLTYNTELSNGQFGYLDQINEFTTFANINIGSIKGIVETSPGSGYPVDPFFIVYEPSMFHLERYDYQIEYTEDNQNFRIGEVVVGQTSGAEARVFYHDPQARILRATRISIADNLSTEDDFFRGELVRGSRSNVTSTIDKVFELRRSPRTGLNADIDAEALSGPGFVTELEVIDSGFGYEDGEPLRLRSYTDPTKEVSVIGLLGKQGIGQGYHLNRKSFLSSDKYIQDSDFYQEYSYEVLTSLPFETYRDTLIKVLHVAGTKPFGSYVSTVEEQIGITLDSVGEDFDILKEKVFINENIFYTHSLS